MGTKEVEGCGLRTINWSVPACLFDCLHACARVSFLDSCIPLFYPFFPDIQDFKNIRRFTLLKTIIFFFFFSNFDRSVMTLIINNNESLVKRRASSPHSGTSISVLSPPPYPLGSGVRYLITTAPVTINGGQHCWWLTVLRQRGLFCRIGLWPLTGTIGIYWYQFSRYSRLPVHIFPVLKFSMPAQPYSGHVDTSNAQWVVESMDKRLVCV